MPSSIQDSFDEMLKTQKYSKKLHVGWYCWLLTEHPVLIVFLCAVIVSAFGSVAFIYTSYPDFGDPSKGFEIRGGSLADRLVTWHKMINETGYNLAFSNYPYQYFKKKSSSQKEIKNSTKSKRSKYSLDNNQKPNSMNQYFCDHPNLNYASWSFKLESNEMRSLWTITGLLAMCQAENDLLSSHSYKDVCIRNNSTSCCRAMTLPNYVAFLAGLQSCSNLNSSSFAKVNSILSDCSQYYCDGRLGPQCGDDYTNDWCSKVSKKCKKHHHAIYAIFHYLFDKSATCSSLSNYSLNYVSAFIPVFRSHSNLVPLYYSNFIHFHSQPVSFYSINFGISEEIFQDHLSSDTIYPMLTMLGVGFILLLYTKSLFITFMTFLSASGAMIVSYFLYKVLFDFKFFPFMNLAAVLVMLGLSADNVLVFFSAWKNSINSVSSSKVDFSATQLSVMMKLTMNRVAWSLFVTCSTTAAAFFASYASQVTAIKCFSVYTGLTVIANLFFSLTWLPACVVIHHKYMRRLSSKIINFISRCFVDCISAIWDRLCQRCCEYSRIFFDQIQVLIIVRLKYLWLLLGLILAIGALCIVFVYPKFRLPTGQTHFHYFKSSHPFERNHDQVFAFQNHSQRHLSVFFVFGIDPEDSGDYCDPEDTGSLHFQRHFDVSRRDSQRWLLNFCQKMKNFSYYSQTTSTTLELRQAGCFIEMLKLWIESRSCNLDPVCCSKRKFPYPPWIFTRCLKEAIFHLHLIPGTRLLPRTPGPRFDPNDALRAVVIGFPLNLTQSASYQQMKNLYEEATSYFEPILQEAPPGLSNGWIISDLEFFALQTGLYFGTVSSMGLSLLVALLVIFITSRNLLISFFASVSIGIIITVTVACLVLIGWELDILESVTVSIAVGLSVDFTAHYAIAYLTVKPCDDRCRRVELTISHTCPAITLAALTTFIAGLGLLPATVLIYYKFGAFLMITTASSWLISTYFFIPLLSIAGPQGTCCSVSLKCRSSEPSESSAVMTETSTFTPSSHQEIIEKSTVV